MKNRILPISVLTLIALAAVPAAAKKAGPHAERAKAHMSRIWDDIDQNEDGKITRTEMRVAGEARFNRTDANKDNKLTPDELKAAHSEHRGECDGDKNRRGKGAEKGHRRGGAEEHIARLDKNKNGKIEQNESRLPKDVFEKIDANGDGSLTAEEMKAAHQKRERAHGKEKFERADANQDGAISRAEATKMGEERFSRMDRNSDNVVTRREAAQAMKEHMAKTRGEKEGQRGKSRAKK